MIYKIYEGYLENVEKKLKRIAKKCNKYGNNFVYKKIGESVEEIKDSQGNKNNYKFIIVEVEGTAKIDNWECVAVIEIQECGNIIKKINTNIDIPEKFKNTKNICEHCNSKRFRNNLFIIHNIETDEWKQVGKSCLKLYTDGLNAEYVTAYIDGITELENNNFYIGENCKPVYNIREVLGVATEIIDKIGFFNSDSLVPTKIITKIMLRRCELDKKIYDINDILKQLNVSFSKKDFYKEDTEEKVENIIKYWENLEEDSDFIYNIKVMIKAGFITANNIGYICYMPEGYNRFKKKEKIEKEKQKEQETEINGHFGKIGERYKNLKVKDILTLSSYETMYGCSYFCKIILADNRVFYWSGLGIKHEMFNGNKYVPCVPESISFTIKEHGEYNHILQTKVTRCNIKYKIL